MKFIVSSKALLSKLQTVGGVISNNSVLPILENFLFDIDGKKLTITATDLDTTMITSMDLEDVDGSGKITMPKNLLMDILKSLPEQPITFLYDEKNFSIELTSEYGNYKLTSDNPDDFPKVPQAEETQTAQIAASVLQTAINNTFFAISNDELRPAMGGLYFEVDPEGMIFVSTDAHKLVRYKRTDVSASEPANFIIPKKALGLLKGAFPQSETLVDLSYNNSNTFFNVDDVQLICRLIDARYPDYNAVIPTENNNILHVNRTDLVNSLKRISIFSNKTTHQVILSISSAELKISAQDLDFSNEAHERLSCTYDGEAMDIGFNARFLIEMLNALHTDEIQLALSVSTRAGLIYPSATDEGEDLLMLIMPVMLNN